MSSSRQRWSASSLHKMIADTTCSMLCPQSFLSFAGSAVFCVALVVLVRLGAASHQCMQRRTGQQVHAAPPRQTPSAPSQGFATSPPTVHQPPRPSSLPPPLPPLQSGPCMLSSCQTIIRLQNRWSELGAEYVATGEVNAYRFMDAVVDLQSINPEGTFLATSLLQDVSSRVSQFNQSVHQPRQSRSVLSATELSNLTIREWVLLDGRDDIPLLTLGWILRDLDTPCIMLYELLLAENATASTRQAYLTLLSSALRHEVSASGIANFELATHLIDEIPRATFVDSACALPPECEIQLRAWTTDLMATVLAITIPMRTFVNQRFDAAGFTSVLPRTCLHAACCDGTGLLPSLPSHFNQPHLSAVPPLPPMQPAPCTLSSCADVERIWATWATLQADYEATGEVNAWSFMNAVLDLQVLYPDTTLLTDSIRSDVETRIRAFNNSIHASRNGTDLFPAWERPGLTMREWILRDGGDYPLLTLGWVFRNLDSSCILLYELMIGNTSANASVGAAFTTLLNTALRYEIDQNSLYAFEFATSFADLIPRSLFIDGVCVLPNDCGPDITSWLRALVSSVLAVALPLRAYVNERFDAGGFATGSIFARTCLHPACCTGDTLLHPLSAPTPPSTPPVPPLPSIPAGCLAAALPTDFIPLLEGCLASRDPPVPLPSALTCIPVSPPDPPALPPSHAPPPTPSATQPPAWQGHPLISAPAIPPPCDGTGLTGQTCQRCNTNESCQHLVHGSSRCDQGAPAAAWVVGEGHKGLDCTAGGQLARLSIACVVDEQISGWNDGHASGNCSITAQVGTSTFVACTTRSCNFHSGVAGVSCESLACEQDLSDGRVFDAATIAFAAAIVGQVDVSCNPIDDSASDVRCFVDVGTLPVALEADCIVSRCVEASAPADMGDLFTVRPEQRCQQEFDDRFPLFCFTVSFLAVGATCIFAGWGSLQPSGGEPVTCHTSRMIHTKAPAKDDLSADRGTQNARQETAVELGDLVQQIHYLHHPSTLRWIGLTVTAGNGRFDRSEKRTVVASTSAHLCSGCTALMGPSGSGKTSLLNAATGLRTSGLYTQGRVLLDGVPLEHWHRGAISLVPQDDVLPAELNAREALIFACALSVPWALIADRLALVEAVLSKLHLLPIAHNLIGRRLAGGRGISGGERKRVSIGASIVTCPRILFLDEPSSGLDAYRAFEIGQLLHSLAEHSNRLVLLSVHQPSSQLFGLFDSLFLLADGRTVYHGSPSEAVGYFNNSGLPSIQPGVAAADHLLHLLATHEPSVPTWEAAAAPTNSKSEREGMPSSASHCKETASLTWCREARWLGWRCLAQLAREPSLLRTQLLVHVLAGVFLGLIFYQVEEDIQGFQNKAGSITSVLFFLAIGGLSTAQTVTREWPLLWSEYSQGLYGAVTYSLTRLMLEMVVLRVLPCVAFGGLFYGLAGLRRSFTALSRFLISTALASADAALIAAAIAACAPRATGATALVSTMVLLVFLLFNGFLLNISDLREWVAWVPLISFAKHATEIILTTELDGKLVAIEVPAAPTIHVRASVVLDLAGLSIENVYLDFLSLMLVFLVMVAVTAIIVALQMRAYSRESTGTQRNSCGSMSGTKPIASFRARQLRLSIRARAHAARSNVQHTHAPASLRTPEKNSSCEQDPNASRVPAWISPALEIEGRESIEARQSLQSRRFPRLRDRESEQRPNGMRARSLERAKSFAVLARRGRDLAF